MIDLEDVLTAARRLKGMVHRTPVLTSRTLNSLTNASVYLKGENFQRGGSFKIRGAYNRVSTLGQDKLRAGVVTYSSGNHAQAVALAVSSFGARAVIVMPQDAPPTKKAATHTYGAEIITYDRYREDRQELSERLARRCGLTLVPPYDDPMVMAGQGTAALELMQDIGDLDALVVPIGGGGLIAGCATAAKGLEPKTQVVGVEPEEGNDTKRSLERGERIQLSSVPRTIADALQATTPGELTFQINREVVDEVVLVSDTEILEAMRFLFERLKIIVEPSGALPVAALLAPKLDVSGLRVGIILSGGNIGQDQFCELFRGPPP